MPDGEKLGTILIPGSELEDRTLRPAAADDTSYTPADDDALDGISIHGLSRFGRNAELGRPVRTKIGFS